MIDNDKSTVHKMGTGTIFSEVAWSNSLLAALDGIRTNT